ncbi:ABC transporter permease [Streptomyces cocklensis]|uniref:Transport permease protein n=1 Tax=Actinacidiphila cocklensis TaxID=887465 RepID=A0A9W4DPU6_9ACTN|nr:ABC transporter permease [Actinacidiphila cocklensis]MDD1057536.1 ABC transporter permease [Actinacidiphila cocklensis]CAG6393839.1 Transport permease protein [Actinacidiphila cocklensis]
MALTTDTLTARVPALREFGYWMRRYRRIWRGTVVISVANPLLFLAAMGAGLGKLVDANHSGHLSGTPYLDFLAPGLLAASAMQNGFIEGAFPVFQSSRTRGNYSAAVATSMRPTDILAGHLLFVAFRVLLSGLLFLGVVVAFGVVGPARALLAAGPVLLTGTAFAAPLMAWAVLVDRQSRLNGLYRFVVMPLYMFSGTFFPISQLPYWLQAVATCTPLYQGVALTRAAALGGAHPGATAVHACYLLAMTAAGIWVSRRSYTHRLNR